LIGDEDEARSVIPPEVAGAIVTSSQLAFQDWFSQVSDHSKTVSSSSTKSSFINDHMVHHARTLLKDHPDVRFIPRNGRYHMLVILPKQTVEIKLKKLNRNRRPSNIPTDTVFKYNYQIPLPLPLQLEFPEVLSPITNLVAGYQANRLKTGVEAVYIVCPEGERNRWEWRIDFEPLPAPTELSKPVEDKPLSKKRIVPKRNRRRIVVRGSTDEKKAE